VFDIIGRDIVTGGACADNDNFLARVVRRTVVLGRVQDLSAEIFLARIMSIQTGPEWCRPISTYRAGDIRHVWHATGQSDRIHDVVDVECALFPVGALDDDGPFLGALIQFCLENRRRGPDVQLHAVCV
jgi:hypothetical protein